MTSTIPFPAYVVGLMSGTSADGVDAALLYTDGRTVAKPHASVFVPYTDPLRQAILGLMQGRGDLATVAYGLTAVHIEAVQQLMRQSPHRPQLIGFHGQTIFHAPEKGVTIQVGDAQLMAKTLGIPVVTDFRSNDVRHGGQGAPLVPLYHAALAENLPKPLMVVNIGGVANITWIGEGGDIVAFDCGPGNALIDDWVSRHTSGRYDIDGALAARGKVDAAAVAGFLQNAFFARPVPKSLDRNHFAASIPPTQLSIEDGAATLTAMTAAAIAKSCELVPQPPRGMLVTGGGRHNPTLMHMLKHYAPCPVKAVEVVGWNGDMLEAEAFAYLAVRSIEGLPLSLPTTTGVSQPVTGGVFYPGESADGS